MTSRAIQLSFFFSVFAVALVLGFFIFQPYFNALILAATFAVIFYPLYQVIARGFGNRWDGFSAFLTVLLVLTLVFTPLVFVGKQVFKEATTLHADIVMANQSEVGVLGDAPEPTNPLLKKLRERFEGFVSQLNVDFGNVTARLTDFLLRNYQNLFQGVAQFLIATFIWFLAFYYFLRDGARLKKVFISFSPLADKYDREILDKIRVSIKSIIGGSLIVAVIQGLLAAGGFALFGIPNPTLWGAVSIVAALIPTIGTGLIVAPAVFYLLIIGSTVPAIGLLAWGIFIVGAIDNILRPKLIERGIRIHPLIILLSVLGGIGFFGPVGFLNGPIIAGLLGEFFGMYRKIIGSDAERG